MCTSKKSVKKRCTESNGLNGRFNLHFLEGNFYCNTKVKWALCHWNQIQEPFSAGNWDLWCKNIALITKMARQCPIGRLAGITAALRVHVEGRSKFGSVSINIGLPRRPRGQKGRRAGIRMANRQARQFETTYTRKNALSGINTKAGVFQRSTIGNARTAYLSLGLVATPMRRGHIRGMGRAISWTTGS